MVVPNEPERAPFWQGPPPDALGPLPEPETPDIFVEADYQHLRET